MQNVILTYLLSFFLFLKIDRRLYKKLYILKFYETRGKKDIMKKLFIENQQIGRYVQKDKTKKKLNIVILCRKRIQESLIQTLHQGKVKKVEKDGK